MCALADDALPLQAQLLVQCVPWHVGRDGFARDEHGCGYASDGFFASGGGCQRHSVYKRGSLWQWSRSGVMDGRSGGTFDGPRLDERVREAQHGNVAMLRDSRYVKRKMLCMSISVRSETCS